MFFLLLTNTRKITFNNNLVISQTWSFYKNNQTIQMFSEKENAEEKSSRGLIVRPLKLQLEGPECEFIKTVIGSKRKP